mmetsp:Transcript_58300/g.127900  ORF Transcript_58300/g.127900 Transcript_58300/m.127900 type:complete len:282 (+) Transcript_58300:93-938(+)
MGAAIDHCAGDERNAPQGEISCCRIECDAGFEGVGLPVGLPITCPGLETSQFPWEEAVIVNFRLLRASADGDLAEMQQALKEGAYIETRAQPQIRPEKEFGVDAPGLAGDQDLCTFFQDGGEDAGGSTASNGGGKGNGWDSGERGEGLTPLMRASHEGQAAAVKLLLQARASPHSQDEDGMRPLHFAASAASHDSCVALIRAGASPSDIDDSDRDAFACLPGDCVLSRADRQRWEQLLRGKNNLGDAASQPGAAVKELDAIVATPPSKASPSKSEGEELGI